MSRLVVLVVVTQLSACGGCGTQRERVSDATWFADATSDAAGDAASDAAFDAIPDAFCIGVASDAAVATSSPSCTTAPTTFIDLAPSRTANIVRVGATLYASEYELDESDNVLVGKVIATDLVTNAQSIILSHLGIAYFLSASDGWIFAAEEGPSGTLWRWRSGGLPEAVLTGRRYLGSVTADESHMYWNEASSNSSSSDVILRRALCGGPIEMMMSCSNTFGLVTDDTYLYCASFDHDVFQVPKDSSAPSASIAYNGYEWSSLIRIGSTLYATDMGNLNISAIATPNGPATTFASSTIGRFTGLAASDDFFYGTSTEGVFSINRSTGAYTLISSAVAESNPVVWNGQLFFETQSTVMRCVD